MAFEEEDRFPYISTPFVIAKCSSSESTSAMDGRENSKLQQQLQPFREQYTSPYFSYPSFGLFTPNNHTDMSKFCPMFSTMEFNEINNARAEADTGNSISFTPSEDSSGYGDHSCAKSDGDSSSEAGGDVSDEEVSLDELLLDGKTKKKIELLAAMVGVDSTDPLIVLNEVVRVLKVLKRINQY